MVNAICKTTTSISASSLTTIAGFLALCTMQLTLGRDIGIVMAKGVRWASSAPSSSCPPSSSSFDKWVEKYRHRTFIPKLTRLSYFVSKPPSAHRGRPYPSSSSPLPLPRARPASTTPCLMPCRRICPALWA